MRASPLFSPLSLAALPDEAAVRVTCRAPHAELPRSFAPVAVGCSRMRPRTNDGHNCAKQVGFRVRGSRKGSDVVDDRTMGWLAGTAAASDEGEV